MTPALGSKNPQVKEGSLRFLARCLSTSPSPIQPGQIKPLSEQLATLLEDSFEGARNEAATALGTLMRMIGERPLNAIMDGLPDVRKSKVKEAYEKATVKAKAGASGPPKPSGPPPTKAPQKKPAPKKIPPKEEPLAPAPEKALDTVDGPQKTAKKPPARFTVSPLSPCAETINNGLNSKKRHQTRPPTHPLAHLLAPHQLLRNYHPLLQDRRSPKPLLWPLQALWIL